MYQPAGKQFGVVAAKPDLKPSRAEGMKNACVWPWPPFGWRSPPLYWAIIIWHCDFRVICEEPVKSGWKAFKILFSDFSSNHTNTHAHTHTNTAEAREDYFSFTVEINERVPSLNLMLTPSL